MPRLLYTDFDVRLPSQVVAFVGEAGSGKSAAMAVAGARSIRAGRRVYYTPPEYNFMPGHPLAQPITLLELVQLDERLSGADILMEEMQTLLSKFQSASTRSFAIRTLLQQRRKRGSNLFYTTNSPRQLDEELYTQTNFHVFCKRWEDPRCAATPKKKHLRDCKDTIHLDIFDTHRKFGLAYDSTGRPRSKHYHEDIFPAIRAYRLYNTDAIVSPEDVLGLTKDVIVGSKAEVKAGVTRDELADELRDAWIPFLVFQNTESIRPGDFAKGLFNNYTIKVNKNGGAWEGQQVPREAPLRVDSAMMGDALRSLGLAKVRGSAGVIYHLPDRSDLEDWMAGLWSPSAYEAAG